MPDSNASDPKVAVLKYDLLIRLSENEIFHDPDQDNAIRSQISDAEQTIAQQFDKGSDEFKNAVYLLLSKKAEPESAGCFRYFMGLVELYIPSSSTLQDAQTRYNECIEDLDSTSNRFGF